MTEVDFFWDPVCPWAWLTSRWVVNVMEQRPLEVTWRFISLRMVNGERDYATDFAPGYERRHTRGLELLRVAAGVRIELGEAAVLPLFTAFGEAIHHEGDAARFDTPAGVAHILEALGYPVGLGATATSTEHDALIAGETQAALDRCGGNVGTPVLTFGPPDGPSFFGPIINEAPQGQEALDLWDAVVVLGHNPHFSELKRSRRGRPQFDI